MASLTVMGLQWADRAMGAALTVPVAAAQAMAGPVLTAVPVAAVQATAAPVVAQAMAAPVPTVVPVAMAQAMAVPVHTAGARARTNRNKVSSRRAARAALLLFSLPASDRAFASSVSRGPKRKARST